MTDTSPSPLITILASVLVAFITSLIVPVFIKPYFSTYFDFKQHLVNGHTHLKIYSNIYTSAYSQEAASPLFKTDLRNARDKLRIIWADIETSYYLIPDIYRDFLVMIQRLPDHDELEQYSRNLLIICNSPIIYANEMELKENKGKDIKMRYKAMKEFMCFVSLYTNIKYSEKD